MKRIAAILVLGLVLRIAFMAVFEGEGNDSTTRILDAAAWLRQSHPIFGTKPWPELNYVYPALAIALGGEFFWSVRVLYLLTGVTNIALLYLLVRELFDERSAELAALLLAINPYHIRCSLDGAMSEIPYLSLVLLALYLAARYRRSPRWPLLVGCGAAVNLAAMFRFDSVLWGPICGYLLFVPAGGLLPRLRDPAAWRAVAILGVVCAIYPVCIALRWNQLHGDPLYFFHTAQADTAQFFSGGGHPRFSPLVYQAYTLVYWPLTPILILTPLLACLAYLGLFGSLARASHAELAIAAGLFTAWLMYSAFRHNILCQFRYSMILQALLLAYVGTGARQVARWLPRVSPQALWTACGFVGLATYVGIVGASLADLGTISRQVRQLNPVQRHPYTSRQALDWISAHVKAPDTVLVFKVTSPYLSLEGAPLTLSGILVRQPLYRPEGLMYTKAEFQDLLNEKLQAAGHLLLDVERRDLPFQDGIARDVLNVPADFHESFEREGLWFHPEVQFGPLRIYRINRSGAVLTSSRLACDKPRLRTGVALGRYQAPWQMTGAARNAS